MSSIDIEANLTPEEAEIRNTVHKFAEEVMRPAGIALDAMADPQDVVAKDSILWDVFEQHRGLGLDAIADPANGFSPAQQARMNSIISEELGWGDSGLAISFGVTGFPRNLATMSGKPHLMERFARPGMVGCWAITEPGHGSDQIVFTTDHQIETLGKPNCIAHKDGNSWVVSGQKAAWVSNGTIADAAALFCAVDEGEGVIGVGGFLVDLESNGVSRGRPLDKIGQRALNQGEIFFDDVRVPGDHLIVAPSVYTMFGDALLTQANSGMGSVFVGCAQSALDLAIDYAKERVQGGTAIIEHQSVRPEPACRTQQHHERPEAPVRDRLEGDLDPDRLRGRERCDPDLRRQRAEQGVRDREDHA